MNDQQKPKEKKLGRPTIYTEELADRICELIATHPWGMKKICSKYPDLPDQVTINQWRIRNELFSRKYIKAKVRQAELLAEDCIDIADDVSNDIRINDAGNEVCNTEFVNRSRLRVDTRKWIAAKLRPHDYGELRQLSDLEEKNEKLNKEIQEIKEKMNDKHKKEY